MSIAPPASGSPAPVAIVEKKELFREIGLGVLYSAIFGSFIYEPLGYFYDRLAAVQDFTQLRELAGYLLLSAKVWLFLLLLVFFCIDYLYSHLLLPKYDLGHLLTDCITLIVMGLSFKAIHLHQPEPVNIPLLMWALAALLISYILGNLGRIVFTKPSARLKKHMCRTILAELVFVGLYVLAANLSFGLVFPILLLAGSCIAYVILYCLRQKVKN